LNPEKSEASKNSNSYINSDDNNNDNNKIEIQIKTNSEKEKENIEKFINKKNVTKKYGSFQKFIISDDIAANYSWSLYNT
jgi:hypothetical protein